MTNDAEKDRVIAMLKEQIRVSDSSYEYYRKRCELLADANERANAAIADIANECKTIVAKLTAELEQLKRS